jgi:hypothetical protein
MSHSDAIGLGLGWACLNMSPGSMMPIMRMDLIHVGWSLDIFNMSIKFAFISLVIHCTASA